MLKKNIDVVVCKSGKNGSILVKNLQNMGYVCYHLPTFYITSIHFDYFKIFSQDFTDIIFSSNNSVKYFINHNIAFFLNSKKLRFWSIGKGTAKILKNYKFRCNFPPIIENSESLLKILLQKISNKSKILLIKGEGGRNFLEKNLINHYLLRVIECYRRVPYSEKKLLKNLSFINKTDIPPRLILFASFDALKASIPVFNFYNNWKRKVIITVNSLRMFTWAKRKGFNNLLFTNGCDNCSLLLLISNKVNL